MSKQTSLRTCTGFAHRKSEEPERWHDFGRTELFVRCCGDAPIFQAKVYEDEQGSHFAWWENEEQRFNYLYWSEALTRACFGNDIARLERDGRGKLCRVSVAVSS